MFRRVAIQQTRRLLSHSLQRTMPLPRQWHIVPSLSLARTRLPRYHYSTESSPAPRGDPETPSQSPPSPSETAAKPATGDTPDLVKEVEAIRKELEERTKEAKDFKDKYTRTVADYRNLQDRTEREKRTVKDFAIQKFAKDLVDSVDNFDRALSAVPEEARADAEKNKDLVDLYNGLKMTEGILLNTLKKHGLERIDPAGEMFDPNRHEAVFQAKMLDMEPNTVYHVQQTGYSLNGRTIRAAKVGVVTAG